MKIGTTLLAVAVIVFGLGCITLAQMTAVKSGKSHPKPQAATSNETTKSVPARSPQGSSAGYPLPILNPDQMRQLSKEMNKRDQSLDLAGKGNIKAGEGDWPQALSLYQQALGLWANDETALYGLGRCADAAGDTASAIRYYRRVIYTDDPQRGGMLPGDGFGTNDVDRMMEFVLLLDKAGQEREALKVYRRAAHLLNYRDADANGGKPYLDVLLPEFGNSPGGWAYTPQRMRAMAYVGHAHEKEGFDNKLAAAELEKAVALAPDSPIPYFYKGRRLVGKGGRSREMLAAFRMAAQLGDDDTKAVVDKKLKDYDIERDAKVEQDMEDLQTKQAAQKK